MSNPWKISLDAVSPGMELEAIAYGPITRDDIKLYAQASGDDNPIHQDEDYAKASGAPTVFAMGMLPAGYLAHAVSDWFGGPQHLRRYKVRFTTRVWPGDKIVCRGTVNEVVGDTIKVSLEAYRAGPGPDSLDLAPEELALKGEADIQLPA